MKVNGSVVENFTTTSRGKVQPIKLVLDIMTLDILCKYCLTRSRAVRMTHFVNLRNMMLMLDPTTYENDEEKRKRFWFILRALDARIDKRLQERSAILIDIGNGLEYEMNFLDSDHIDLVKDELDWVNNLISETLQYAFLYQKMPQLQDLITRFNTSSYQTRGTIAQEIELAINDLKNGYRKSRVDNSLLNSTFSLRSGVFENMITDTYDTITSPSRRLICGMTAMNEMVGGGFESGRTYCLLGNGGAGKSITLLNLAIQLKKYNTNYQLQDPSKTPCVVLLTMENTIVETITRMFDMTTNSMGMSMGDYSLDQVIAKLRSEGKLVLDSTSPIDIIIKYMPNRSVDTSYLYTLCDDLEDEGYEVICMILDHMKRIRSINRNPDLRLELGDIVNELKVFAADRDIPLLTATHLNREAQKITDENNNRTNRVDYVSKFGKSTVGESMLIIDNLDCSINIGKDYDEEGMCWMGFGLGKMRDKTKRTYFVQPFADGGEIRLVEDVGGIPQFRESLHKNPNIMQRNPSIRMNSSNMMTNLDDMIDDKVSDNAWSNIKSFDVNQQTEDTRELHCPLTFYDSKTSVSNEFQNDIEALRAQLRIA